MRRLGIGGGKMGLGGLLGVSPLFMVSFGRREEKESREEERRIQQRSGNVQCAKPPIRASNPISSPASTSQASKDL